MPITSSAKRNTATVKIWNIPHTETCRNGREIIPSHFWQAADQFERANGSTYRELEIALPRELTPEQRLELVQDFCTSGSWRTACMEFCHSQSESEH